MIKTSQAIINQVNYMTPSKREVYFINHDNSFQVRQPISSNFVSKQITQYTPSTDYARSNIQLSDSQKSVHLLSSSKNSTQQHLCLNNNQNFQISTQKDSSQKLAIRESFPQRNSELKAIRKNLGFANYIKSKDKQISEELFSVPQKTNQIQPKIKTLKHSINSRQDQMPNLSLNLSKPFTFDIAQKLQNEKKKLPSVQKAYCKHFFNKIYKKYGEKRTMNRLEFASILLDENLIEDLVKDRHLVQKNWKEICCETKNKQQQGLSIKIIFSFLVSVLGYSVQEIFLFQRQQKLLKIHTQSNLDEALNIFKYFQGKNVYFKVRRLSMQKTDTLPSRNY